MRILFIFFFTFSISSSWAQKKFYSEIDAKTYNSYKVIHTVMNKGSFLVTRRKEFKRYNSNNECVRIDYGSNKRYFQLNYDTYFMNDTTIYEFYVPFKMSLEDDGMLKNGIWVYTTFSRKSNEGILKMETVSGLRFVVDSIPPTWDYKELPKKEGIYFYKNNELVQVSTEQSNEVFESLKKDGFYFFPNTGRLFTKHYLRSIK